MKVNIFVSHHHFDFLKYNKDCSFRLRLYTIVEHAWLGVRKKLTRHVARSTTLTVEARLIVGDASANAHAALAIFRSSLSVRLLTSRLTKLSLLSPTADELAR